MSIPQYDPFISATWNSGFPDAAIAVGVGTAAEMTATTDAVWYGHLHRLMINQPGVYNITEVNEVVRPSAGATCDRLTLCIWACPGDPYTNPSNTNQGTLLFSKILSTANISAETEMTIAVNQALTLTAANLDAGGGLIKTLWWSLCQRKTATVGNTALGDRRLVTAETTVNVWYSTLWADATTDSPSDITLAAAGGSYESLGRLSFTTTVLTPYIRVLTMAASYTYRLPWCSTHPYAVILDGVAADHGGKMGLNFATYNGAAAAVVIGGFELDYTAGDHAGTMDFGPDTTRTPVNLGSADGVNTSAEHHDDDYHIGIAIRHDATCELLYQNRTHGQGGQGVLDFCTIAHGSKSTGVRNSPIALTGVTFPTSFKTLAGVAGNSPKVSVTRGDGVLVVLGDSRSGGIIDTALAPSLGEAFTLPKVCWNGTILGALICQDWPDTHSGIGNRWANATPGLGDLSEWKYIGASVSFAMPGINDISQLVTLMGDIPATVAAMIAAVHSVLNDCQSFSCAAMLMNCPDTADTYALWPAGGAKRAAVIEYNTSLRLEAIAQRVTLYDTETVISANQAYFTDDFHFTAAGNQALAVGAAAAYESGFLFSIGSRPRFTTSRSASMRNGSRPNIR